MLKQLQMFHVIVHRVEMEHMSWDPLTHAHAIKSPCTPCAHPNRCMKKLRISLSIHAPSVHGSSMQWRMMAPIAGSTAAKLGIRQDWGRESRSRWAPAAMASCMGERGKWDLGPAWVNTVHGAHGMHGREPLFFRLYSHTGILLGPN